MRSIKSGKFAKATILTLVLLNLFFQVQTVFACEMMEHAGSIEDCCCDTDLINTDVRAPEIYTPCCDIGTELTVKGVDANKKQALLPFFQASLDIPPATFILLSLSVWPDSVLSLSSPPFWDLNSNPDDPGTQTYLSTLRLRI